MKKIVANPKFKAMKCHSCSSPVYYNAEIDGFECFYCGNISTYDGDDGVEETAFNIDHFPISLKDGNYYLKDIGEARDMAYGRWKPDKNWEYIINQRHLSHQKRQNYSKREMFMHNCPMCGAIVEAFATQNIWTCNYCKNKFIKEDVIASNNYLSFDVIDTGDENLPHFAIPFSISREEAKRIILNFASLRPNAFKEQNLESRVNELWTFYIPYQISDISVVMEVENELGNALLFQDYVNFTTPITRDHNQHMMMDIGPWDFSKIVPFSTKFAEGDIHFSEAYSPESQPVLFLRENTLRPEVYSLIKEVYPGNKHRINWIREEVRTARTVMLPVYFLDKMSKGIKVYFMVNGQTGAVCAMGRGQMEGRKTLFAPGKIDMNRVSETTIKSGFKPVIEVSPGVFKNVSHGDAFIKKSMIKRIFENLPFKRNS